MSLEDSFGSPLERTLAAAVKDAPTVTPEGRPLGPHIEGVSIRDVQVHVDERGSVIEVYDQRWGWHPDPIVFAHCFTIRPGFVKGWGLHKLHEDRYFILAGEMDLVLFDPRPESSTCGIVQRIPMSEQRRQLINIPRFVWHAERNIGRSDVVVIDFPTAPYNHEDPDKYRLPIDTPLIPYSFKAARGW